MQKATTVHAQLIRGWGDDRLWDFAAHGLGGSNVSNRITSNDAKSRDAVATTLVKVAFFPKAQECQFTR